MGKRVKKVARVRKKTSEYINYENTKCTHDQIRVLYDLNVYFGMTTFVLYDLNA